MIEKLQKPTIITTKSHTSEGLFLPDIHINKKKEKEKEKSTEVKFKDYNDIENMKLIFTYGPQIYEFARETEINTSLLTLDDTDEFRLLKNHDITSKIRTKLVDWLFEVFYAYKNDESSIYLTIHLMDSFIYKTKQKLTNNDIHLIGVVCLFISSKAEDLSPLDMGTIHSRISHGKFKDKEIRKKEKEILEIVNFNLFFNSSYDFIRNFIYDFLYNNKKVINKYKMKRNIETLERTAIYISKIILHSEIFAGFKSSLKAIACLIVAFDIVRSDPNALSKDSEGFMDEWINFLISQSRYEPQVINRVYNQINAFLLEFDKVQSINNNLKKNFGLIY